MDRVKKKKKKSEIKKQSEVGETLSRCLLVGFVDNFRN
jgi:hypothetical protein